MNVFGCVLEIAAFVDKNRNLESSVVRNSDFSEMRGFDRKFYKFYSIICSIRAFTNKKLYKILALSSIIDINF